MIEHMIENRYSISYAWAVYMCINEYVYVYTYMHTCTPTHTRICAQSTYTRYTHTCMHTYNTCTHSDLDTCIHTRVCLCVCVRVCTRLFVRVCRYIKLGPQRSQYQQSHDGTTHGHSFPHGTSPSLSTARSGKGGSMRREVHGRGHGEGRPMVIRQRRVWSAQARHGRKPAAAGVRGRADEVFGGEAVVMVAAGSKHTACVTAKGTLWIWGIGQFGRLGHGDREQRQRLARLRKERFGGSPAMMVSCGGKRTLVLTAVAVWSCGCGSYGQLGHGDTADKLVLTLVGAEGFQRGPNRHGGGRWTS